MWKGPIPCGAVFNAGGYFQTDGHRLVAEAHRCLYHLQC